MPIIRVVTNFDRFPLSWQLPSGEAGESKTLHTFRDFIRSSPSCDLYIINGSPVLAMKLAAIFVLLPFLRKPIIGVDLVLRQPRAEWRRLLKKCLLSRVDHFIHYFKDLSYYEKYYGIGPDRSSYVAFKPNLRYQHDYHPNPEGEYVLCVGWSLRDYDTFFEAVATLPYPAAIPRPNFPQLRFHGSRFSRRVEDLPPQVRVLDHDWAYNSLVPIIGGARLVVLPILKSPYYPAGLSLYLDSMLMGKCVVITEGPGVSDLLSGEALTVPPEDPERLAMTIRRAWEDDALRRRTAEAGYRYAVSLGGEPEMFRRILGEAIRWLESERSTASPKNEPTRGTSRGRRTS